MHFVIPKTVRGDRPRLRADQPGGRRVPLGLGRDGRRPGGHSALDTQARALVADRPPRRRVSRERPHGREPGADHGASTWTVCRAGRSGRASRSSSPRSSGSGARPRTEAQGLASIQSQTPRQHSSGGDPVRVAARSLSSASVSGPGPIATEPCSLAPPLPGARLLPSTSTAISCVPASRSADPSSA